MINLILCGGSGTRLWPLSKNRSPKQFLKLFNEKSLYHLTLDRNKSICNRTLVIVNKNQLNMAREQIDHDKYIKYIIEPIGRNTAPAIAISCLGLDYDDIVLVTPSDQLIKTYEPYVNMVHKAKILAESGYIVTFGVKPKYPETGFGYIETLDQENVLSFKEKPDILTAQKYTESNKYFWNCGIFCFKVSTFLSELKKYSSEIFETSKIAYENRIINNSDNNIEEIPLDFMASIPSNSIDYAVLEKSKKIKVVCGDIEWSDLGSFDSLEKEYDKDENGNTTLNKCISINSSNNFIYSNKKVVAIDVEDLIVIDSEDSLLICQKGQSQKVKIAIEMLDEKFS